MRYSFEEGQIASIAISNKSNLFKDPLLLYSIEAEQLLLSFLMQNDKAWDQISGIINGDSFYRKEHRQVFRIMQELAEKGESLDVVTLSEELDCRSLLEGGGGLDYLIDLAKKPCPIDIKIQAHVVVKKAMQRHMISAALLSIELNELANDYE